MTIRVASIPETVFPTVGTQDGINLLVTIGFDQANSCLSIANITLERAVRLKFCRLHGALETCSSSRFL